MTSLAHDSPELAQKYDRLSDSQLAGGKRLVERLSLKAGDRVLDVGCGTGRLARWIAEIVGPSGVVGVDPLIDRVDVARAAAPRLSFAVGQAEDLGAFEAESFDAVSMSAVFHWVRDKPKALAEARRVLRPGGRLGLTTLLPGSPAFEHDHDRRVPNFSREIRYIGQVSSSCWARAGADRQHAERAARDGARGTPRGPRAPRRPAHADLHHGGRRWSTSFNRARSATSCGSFPTTYATRSARTSRPRSRRAGNQPASRSATTA